MDEQLRLVKNTHKKGKTKFYQTRGSLLIWPWDWQLYCMPTFLNNAQFYITTCNIIINIQFKIC